MKALHDFRLRLLIIVLLIIAGSIGTKQLIYYGLNHYTDNHKKFTEIFRGHTRYDILMLGSSRMRNHLNPAIIDSVTGYKSYNAGSEAATMPEIKMMLDAYLLAHPPPKLVVLNLDYLTLHIHGQYIGFYPKYLEFKDIPPIAALLRKNGVRVGLYRLLPFLETAEIDDYNRGTILKVAAHQRKLPPDDYFCQGFESNGTAVMPDRDIPCRIVDDVPLEDEGKADLEELLRSCRARGIRVVLIYAPEYRRANEKCVTNFGEIMDYYHAVAAPYNIPLIRSDSLAINYDSSLFASIEHLNRKGAAVYSAIFARQIVESGWMR